MRRRSISDLLVGVSMRIFFFFLYQFDALHDVLKIKKVF